MRFPKSSIVITSLTACLFLQACSPGGGGGGSTATTNPDAKSCEQQVAYKNYFEELNVPDSYNGPEEENVIRERFVKVNMEELKADILAGSSSLYLDLFDDQQVKVIVEQIEKTSDTNVVVSGRIENDPFSSVALAIEDDVLIATVKPTDEKEFQIVYRGEDTHAIQEAAINENEGECLAETTIGTVESAEHEEEELDAQTAEADGEESIVAATPVIDVLVGYTPAARSQAGGDSAIRAQIQTAVANANKGFRDSAVRLAVRLVGIIALRQNETSNYSNDLGALKSKTDGKWDEVHAERSRLGADQVSVIGAYTNGGGVAGIGYVSSTVTTAFTTVKRSALSSMFTFSHELGHNIGLQHSDGYVNSSGRFRTQMAYGSYPRIVRFSNPSVKYNGYTTGTSSQNSASKLNSRGSRIANLVATRVPSGSTNVPVVPPSCN